MELVLARASCYDVILQKSSIEATLLRRGKNVRDTARVQPILTAGVVSKADVRKWKILFKITQPNMYAIYN